MWCPYMHSHCFVICIYLDSIILLTGTNIFTALATKDFFFSFQRSSLNWKQVWSFHRMHWQHNLEIRDTEVTFVATIKLVCCSQLFFIHFFFKGISVPHQTIQKTSTPQVWDMTLKRDTGGKELVLQYWIHYPRQLLKVANSRIHPVFRLCTQRGRVYSSTRLRKISFIFFYWE